MKVRKKKWKGQNLVASYPRVPLVLAVSDCEEVATLGRMAALQTGLPCVKGS